MSIKKKKASNPNVQIKMYTNVVMLFQSHLMQTQLKKEHVT